MFSKLFRWPKSTVKAESYTDDEKKAAVAIQRVYRHYLVKKKHHLKHLEFKALHDYNAFFVGNDPAIEGLEKYAPEHGQVALVATSGLKAVLLACQLNSKQLDKKQFPKIILIDNSKQVYELWCKLRAFVASIENQETFIKKLPEFILLHNKILRDLSQRETDALNLSNKQVLDQFVKELFSCATWHQVRNAIINTTFIRQDWRDAATFIKIRQAFNFLNLQHVFVYASNICSIKAIKPDMGKVLHNIAALKPELSIHTDCCPTHRCAEQFFLFSGSVTEKEIQQSLSTSKCVKEMMLQNFKKQCSQNTVLKELKWSEIETPRYPDDCSMQTRLLSHMEDNKIIAELKKLLGDHIEIKIVAHENNKYLLLHEEYFLIKKEKPCIESKESPQVMMAKKHNM